jgi:hypothetical protein
MSAPHERGEGPASRYRTVVEDGTVYVEREGRLAVGDRDAIVAAVGGPAWTITYDDWETDRYGDLDTSDEGLTVDVVDMMQAMTHSERFVETLRAHPLDTPEGDDALAPRTGLFVGKLLENLEHGVD